MHNTNQYTYIVVEDEPLICNNIIKKITSLHLPFELCGTASNGSDAIALFEVNYPELVITDIRMPEQNGLKLLEYLYKNHPQTKTIIISGYDDFSYAQSAIKSRAFDYLLKPITKEALSETLQRVLITLNVEHKTRAILDTESKGLSKETLCKLMLDYLQLNYEHDISLSELARQIGFSQEYLGKVFKKQVGVTPSKYVTRLRINKAKLLLTNQPELEIQNIAKLVGYNSAFYFSRAFKASTGMQPSEFRAFEHG